MLHLSDNIAGVTILAFGNGAPDIFTSLVTDKDEMVIMFTELIGAGVFVTAIIAGSVAVISPFRVDLRAFMRDCCFYIMAVCWISLVVEDDKVYLWEAASKTSLRIISQTPSPLLHLHSFYWTLSLQMACYLSPLTWCDAITHTLLPQNVCLLKPIKYHPYQTISPLYFKLHTLRDFDCWAEDFSLFLTFILDLSIELILLLLFTGFVCLYVLFVLVIIVMQIFDTREHRLKCNLQYCYSIYIMLKEPIIN